MIALIVYDAEYCQMVFIRKFQMFITLYSLKISRNRLFHQLLLSIFDNCKLSKKTYKYKNNLNNISKSPNFPLNEKKICFIKRPYNNVIHTFFQNKKLFLKKLFYCEMSIKNIKKKLIRFFTTFNKNL